jgi:hypothetical protein
VVARFAHFARSGKKFGAALGYVRQSAVGPQRRFTAAQGAAAMEGKPDGRRTRPEPLLLTQSGEPLSGTAYCEQNAFDSREAMSGSSGRAGQDEHMPQSPELRQDVII